LKGRTNLEDVDGRVILKYIFKEQHLRAWTRFIWLRIGTGGDGELSCSIKGGEFVD